MVKRILSFLAVALMTGCTATEETFFLKPIPAEAGVPGIAADAKQRFIWLPKRNVRELKEETASGTSISYTYQITPQPVVCAEPSPDAVSAFAASFSASLSAAVRQVDVSASVSRSIAETVKALTHRTEFLQLLRDGYYRACEAYSNGMVGEFGYGLILNQIDNVMLRMAALNVIGQQRPLPETAEGRQALAAAEARATLIESAKTRAQQALAQRNSIQTQFDQANASLVAATARKTAAEARKSTLTSQRGVAGVTDARKAEIDKELVVVEGAIAGADVERKAAETAVSEVSGRRTAANTSLATADQKVTDLESGFETLATAAAAVERPPIATEALPFIKDIATKADSHSTVVGACLMWFAQHLNVPKVAVSSEPAIADICRGVVGKPANEIAAK